MKVNEERIQLFKEDLQKAFTIRLLNIEDETTIMYAKKQNKIGRAAKKCSIAFAGIFLYSACKLRRNQDVGFKPTR